MLVLWYSAPFCNKLILIKWLGPNHCIICLIIVCDLFDYVSAVVECIATMQWYNTVVLRPLSALNN